MAQHRLMVFESHFTLPSPDVVLIGGAAHDVVARLLTGIETTSSSITFATSNAGIVVDSCGGVARNVCESLIRMGVECLLVSAVGDDAAGCTLVAHLQSLGPLGSRSSRGIQILTGERTARFCAIHGVAGDLVCAVADMDILKRHPTLQQCMLHLPDIVAAKVVFIDGNMVPETMKVICSSVHAGRGVVVFEPVSISKCEPAVLCGALPFFDYVTPNASELIHMHNIFKRMNESPDNILEEGQPGAILQACQALVGAGVKVVVVTLGAAGAMAALRKGHPQYPQMRSTPPLVQLPQVATLPAPLWSDEGDLVTVTVSAIPVPPKDLCNTLGAGDAFAAGLCFALARGLQLPNALQCGVYAAWHSVRTEHTVCSTLQGFL
eukprot:GGOE01018372.1.p1 GENE.GGOE01018372.1~~GGOE01018372.1.p1  ORF type:complete len:388 (-),score=65.92 GGOE01018372.1:97-1233(-)